MIKKIRNWALKSEKNNNLFLFYCITFTMLFWFIPFQIHGVYKHGWFGKMSWAEVWIFISLIFLSIWIGFKIAMRFLYGKER